MEMMRNSFTTRLIGNALFLLFILFCGGALFGDGVQGEDAPEGFKWQRADENQLSYGILSLDGKERSFYVDTGTFFAPLKASASRDVYSRYVSNPTKRIKFYTRRQEEKKVFFDEAFSVEVEGLKDFMIVIMENDSGEILAKTIDISLEKMPLASLSVINLSHHNLGLSADKTFAKLDPFDSFSKKFASDTEQILASTLKMYDLKDPKSPQLLLTKTYSFWTSKRVVVFFFELPRTENASERPASLVMYDRGPR